VLEGSDARYGPAVGANAPLLRYFVVLIEVAAYLGLRLLLHLDLDAYMLAGIPFLVAFQLGIQRRPLRTLWVRSGPPLRVDRWFVVLWVLFSLYPGYELLIALSHGNLLSAAYLVMDIVGAFGMAYAVRAMRLANLWQLMLCVLTVAVLGILPSVISLVLPHVLNLHLHLHAATSTAERPSLLAALQAGLGTFLLMPRGFVVEEVFFRGALDTYLHAGERGVGWLSAIFVSALWGLWHLTAQDLTAGHLISTIIGLMFSQVVIGVPLSLWWRKSGNLMVNDTAHAVLDAWVSALPFVA